MLGLVAVRGGELLAAAAVSRPVVGGLSRDIAREVMAVSAGLKPPAAPGFRAHGDSSGDRTALGPQAADEHAGRCPEPVPGAAGPGAG